MTEKDLRDFIKRFHNHKDKGSLSPILETAQTSADVFNAEDATEDMKKRAQQEFWDALCTAVEGAVEGNYEGTSLINAMHSRWGDDVDGLLEEVYKRRPDLFGEHKKLATHSLATVTAERVEWLWDDRMALGTLSLLTGPPGLGKSTIASTIAAQVTTGSLPGAYEGTPKNVLVCATEDSTAHTIKPRLLAASADVDRVLVLDERNPVSLPDDVDELGEIIRDNDVALVILDPLTSRVNGRLDTHKDSETRQALEKVAAMADETGCTVLGIMHHNKGSRASSTDRVMGSVAFTAVARSVFHVIPDPEDENEERRIFQVGKNNLGRFTKGRAFHMVTATVSDGEVAGIETGAVEWLEEVEGSVNHHLKKAEAKSQVVTAEDQCMEWLAEYLEECGGSAPYKQIKESAEGMGFKKWTLDRARKRMDDISIENDPNDGRIKIWTLPDPDDNSNEVDNSNE